jgi:hypothetical protein
MSTNTLFTEMHTTNHVSEHVLQCASWYPVHSALNFGLKLLHCVWMIWINIILEMPPKKKSGGLSPAIVEATISLKWGVQETQIQTKPWVSWLFEHPVANQGKFGERNNEFSFRSRSLHTSKLILHAVKYYVIGRRLHFFEGRRDAGFSYLKSPLPRPAWTREFRVHWQAR